MPWDIGANLEDSWSKDPSVPRQGYMIAAYTIKAHFLRFANLVEIDLRDGSIKKLPGFTTMDAAALEFWDMIAKLREADHW